MSLPAARVGDMHVCPMVTGIVPHVGGPILPPCAVTVLTCAMPQARVTDMCTCVGPPDIIIPPGAATVLVMKLPAARMGDMTAHGGAIVLGCFTVLIGSAGGGAAPVQVGAAIKIEGTPEFQMATVAALAQIASTPSGAKLLADLDASGKTITIKETAGGNSVNGFTGDAMVKNGANGSGSNSTVNFNPNNPSIGSEPWETRPPAIGLAHELVHAQHAAEGSIDTSQVTNDSKPDPADPTKFATEMKEEVRTAGIPPHNTDPYNENKIRSEWDPKQPERKWY